MHFLIWNKSIDVSLSGHKSFRGFLPMRPKHIVYITIRYIYLGLNKMYFFLILCYIKKKCFHKTIFFFNIYADISKYSVKFDAYFNRFPSINESKIILWLTNRGLIRFPAIRFVPVVDDWIRHCRFWVRFRLCRDQVVSNAVFRSNNLAKYRYELLFEF